MKNLLLLLVLANILYFMWGLFGPEEQQSGIVIVEETDLGPPLTVSQQQAGQAITSVGAVLGSIAISKPPLPGTVFRTSPEPFAMRR